MFSLVGCSTHRTTGAKIFQKEILFAWDETVLGEQSVLPLHAFYPKIWTMSCSAPDGSQTHVVKIPLLKLINYIDGSSSVCVAKVAHNPRAIIEN